MRNLFLQSLMNRLLPAPATPIDPVIHQIGHDAVANALNVSVTLEDGTSAGYRIEPQEDGGTHIAVEADTFAVNSRGEPWTPSTRDTNSPQYHLDLANKIAADLAERASKLEKDIHDLAMTYQANAMKRAAIYENENARCAAEFKATCEAMEAELAGIRVTNSWYVTAPAVLAPEAPRPALLRKTPAPAKRTTRRKMQSIEQAK
jgi:hypothetical protein